MTNRLRTFGFALVLATTTVVSIDAGQQPASPAAGQQAGPPGAVAQGVHVRGRWVVEVRNPDRTLVSRHEFDNALTGEGGTVLAGMLGRFYRTIPEWSIYLESGEGLCAPSRLDAPSRNGRAQERHQ
jgi:hypothetical protein